MNDHEAATTAARVNRWIIAEPPAQAAVESLSKELNIPATISKILLQRGIDTFEKARAYFRPSFAFLHDPFLMSEMTEATERILRALERKERFLVFGDYDVDGTNGTAMLFLFLQELGADVRHYIPDRIREGYGISRHGIDIAHQNGITIFISVDCGVTAVEQVDYARSLGIDVIICDHHEVGGTLPKACAVLDPIKPEDPYPFKGLCGCGVAFKLMQAITRTIGREEMLKDYLDFVALATTADIVPLHLENRALVRMGLDLLNKSPRPGIKSLIESAGLPPRKISTSQIVFGLAPRINAVGRLGDAMRAVRLLTCKDPSESVLLARVLEEENRIRRKIDEETFIEAQELSEKEAITGTPPAYVLHQPGWHPGVIGIVASRISEKYYRPSILMTTVDGVAKGSARSIPGFDIYEALKLCKDMLLQFGGHKYAAGLTVEVARLEEFRKGFLEVVNVTLPEELKTPAVRIDAEITLSELTPRFIRILREFAPFGPGNARPSFLARNVEVTGHPRIVGKNHLRLRARQNGVVFDAIGFGLGHLLPEITQATGRNGVECVFSVDETEQYAPSGTGTGDSLPQLKIRDIRVPTRTATVHASLSSA